MTQTVDRKMVRSWTEELEAVDERLPAHFARSEVRERAHDYLVGLLSKAERKNGWQLAEVTGNTTPYGLQHLSGRANWDADEVRDDLREYVLEYLGGDESVLIVDETGFIKKGDKSVGVKRQYTGTAGKTENCQVGVFLAYASRSFAGQAFIDRELYLPEEWATRSERRAARTSRSARGGRDAHQTRDCQGDASAGFGRRCESDVGSRRQCLR